jgi:hypothetical protein
MIFLFIYFLSATATIEQIPDFTINQLFTNLDKKSVPLYYCKGWTAGIPWKLPPPISCPLIPTDKPSEVVDITVWWADITHQTIPGYECFMERQQIRTWSNFIGATDRNFKKSKHAISEKECRDMVRTQVSPMIPEIQKSLPIVRLSDGFFGTTQVLVEKYYWLYSYQHTVTNFYMIAISISASDSDDYIMTTSKIIDRCRLQKGVCDTETGVLVWSPGDMKVCRLKEGETTACLLTQDRMSCPSLEMSITKIESKLVCGMKMGGSKQGILFSQNNYSVNSEIVLTSEARIKVKERIRLRRDAGAEIEKEARVPAIIPGLISMSDKVPKQQMMPGSQINAKLLYMYQIVESNYHFGIQTIHSQVCKAHQSHLQLLRMLAAGGQPSTLVRTLMHNPGYRATKNGDLLEIYKCQEIIDYMLLPQTECTLEWPVEFVSGTEKKIGYLTGITHEIMDTPTYVPCPAPNYYFEYGNYTVHLTNRSIIETFPILPSSYDDVSMKRMPELSFGSPGIYLVDEISGADTIAGLMKNMNKQTRIDQIINARVRGDQLTPEQMYSMQVLKEYLVSPFQNSLATICIIGLFLIIGFVLIKFCYRKKHLISGRFRNRFRSRSNYLTRRRTNDDIEADYISLQGFAPEEHVNSVSVKKLKRLVRGPIPKPRPKMTIRDQSSKSVQTDDSFHPLSPKLIHRDAYIPVPPSTLTVYPTDELKKLEV